jgi:hypothetical protein
MGNVATSGINATYSGANFSELFLEPIFRDSDIFQFRVIPNVKHTMNLYTADALSCIVKKYTGCGDDESGTYAVTDKVITAGRLRVAVSECQDAFFGTYIEESFKNGINVFDLSGTALMDNILANVRQSIGNDVTKLAWHGDTTAGSDCYSSLDGWWKLLKADATVDGNKTAIANSGAWTAGDGIIALRAMYADAPAALQGVPTNEKKFFVSPTIYNDYLTSIEGVSSDAAYTALKAGGNVTFRGIEVVPMHTWDEAAATLSLTDDIMACYTALKNLVVGTDTNDPQGEMKMFYDDLTEKVYVRSYFKMGVNFLYDSTVQIGY